VATLTLTSLTLVSNFLFPGCLSNVTALFTEFYDGFDELYKIVCDTPPYSSFSDRFLGLGRERSEG